MSTPAPLLEVDALVVQYGPAVAVDGVSLTLREGERVALIGPNGAGKSSLVNAVCGLVPPSAGVVRVRGENVTGAAPGALVRRGVTQVPEGRQVFPTLPVEANLLLGAFGREFRFEIVTATLRFLRRRAEIEERLRRVYELMPTLHELRERPAGQTSGGEQQMVAIGRALMADPRLLAVDELSLGLAPIVVQTLAEFLVRLNEEEGVALLLVEQNALLAFELCSPRVRARGRPARAQRAERGAAAGRGRAGCVPGRRAGGRRVVTEFLQAVVVGISIGSAFALVGIGMVLIFQTTGIVNFAQGSFAVLGGLFMVGLVDDVPGIVAGVVTVLLVARDRLACRRPRRRLPAPHHAAREPRHHARRRAARRLPEPARLRRPARTPTRTRSSGRGTSAASPSSPSTSSSSA